MISESTLESLADYLDSTGIILDQALTRLGQKMLVPIAKKVQEEITELAEQRKVMERSRERYETVLAKYSTIPKLREFALIREVSL